MTPNNKLADVAAAITRDGTIGNTNRGDEYEAFLHAAFGRGAQLRRKRTSCAVFVGTCRVHAGNKPKRKWPRLNGICTWVGVGWFRRKREWIPYKPGLKFRRGDIPYWCGGNRVTWYGARNGHVGVLLEGEGYIWRTAEGGGGDGTDCRQSDEPKDIRKHRGRPLRGVWREDLIAGLPGAGGEYVAEEIRWGSVGSRVAMWQIKLMRNGYALPLWGADGDFGAETDAATRKLQKDRDPPETGIVDKKTWELIT